MPDFLIANFHLKMFVKIFSYYKNCTSKSYCSVYVMHQLLQLKFFLLFKQYLNTTFALRATKCSSRELTSDQLTRIDTWQRQTNLQG